MSTFALISFFPIFTASPNQQNDCSGRKVSKDDDPIEDLKNHCGFDGECSDEEKHDIGEYIAEAYINPNPICQDEDIAPSDQGELDLRLELGLNEKKEFLNDDEFNDQDWNKNRMKPEDLVLMRKHQWYLLPVDYIASHAMYLEYLFNPDDPISSTIRCPVCHQNHGRFFLKPHLMSAFANEKGTLKNTLFDNLAAIKKHKYSASHQVCEHELKMEKDFFMQQELGKFVNENYTYVVTNRHMRMVYNGKLLILHKITIFSFN